MTKVREHRTGFSAGEVDPLLHGRTDLKDYFSGAATCSNFALLVQGGLMDRPGTRYVADLGTTTGRVIEFIFADGQEYLLYLTPLTLAIYRDDGTACALTVLSGSPNWTADTIAGLEYDYNGDTIIITDATGGIFVVKRTGAAAFSFSTFSFETTDVQPFFKFVADSGTLTPSGTTGAITVTSSVAVPWQPGHIGTTIRYEGKRITITGITSDTVASGTVVDTLPGTTASKVWDEQVFSAVRGWARSVTFHEDRLWFGGSKERPTCVFGSKVGAYFNFATGSAADTDAIIKNMTFRRSKAIKHIASAEHLVIFTDGGEIYMPKPTDKILTPSNASFRWQSPFGSSSIKPRDIDGAALFVQRTQKAVRDFVYDDLQQKYKASALSLRSAHLLTGPIDMAVLYGTDTRPEQYAFIPNSDGTMAVLHVLRDEKLAGWTPWSTDGKFVSVASTFDELFLVVERVINGVTRYYLEKLDWSLTVDCARRIDLGSPGATFTGLAHLEGKSVYAVNAAATLALGAKTVSGGAVTFEDTLQVAEIGLNYEPTYQPLAPDGALANGPITTEMRRVSAVSVMVKSSITYSVNGQVQYPRMTTDDFSTDAAAQDSTVKWRLSGYSRRPSFTLKRQLPVRMYLIGLTIETDL